MLEKLRSLIYSDLVISSPVLSGNMQSLIQYGQIGEKYCEIVIDAPYYDEKLWKEKGVVSHTGKVVNGTTAYAHFVNQFGGFGTHNKSEHWVNRVLNDCCTAIANEVGGIVINELPL